MEVDSNQGGCVIMGWRYQFKRPLPTLYQFDALKRALKRGRFGIFFEQRVGKTRVAIDFCGVKHASEGKTKVLVICPKSVMTVWPEAIRQYIRVPRYWIGEHPKPLRHHEGALNFYVINYDMARILVKKLIAWGPDVLIADEIHYCKHHTSKRSRAVQRIADTTKCVLGLTGTPGKPENGWFGIMRVIDETVFGKYFAQFERAELIATRARGYLEVQGYQDEERLKAKLAAASTRVLRKDVMAEPHTEDVIVPVILEPAVKDLYKQLDKDSYAALPEGEVTAGLVITKDLRLHQLAGGWLKLDDGTEKQVSRAKLDKCLELVADLIEQGKQVIVVCRFTKEIEVLREAARIKDWKALTMQGASTAADRDRVLKLFQSGLLQVLIAQEQVISVGIDLTAAHNVIFFSVDFNLDTFQQVRDRVMGRAQEHDVTYWYLQAKGTIDKEVYDALRRGKNVVQALVDSRRWKAGSGPPPPKHA